MPVWNLANNIKRGSAQVTKIVRGGNSPWAAYNAATGGTVATVTNYNGTGETWKVHTFTSNGTFTVTQSVGAFPFRVLAIGKGGNGASGGPYYTEGGNGGAGESILNDNKEFTVGNHAVVIGSPSSVNGVVARAGGSGGSIYIDGGGVWRNGSNGTSYSRITTNITGSSRQTAGPSGGRSGFTGLPGTAPGGGGRGGQENAAGGAGARGEVIIAYRIA